GQPEEEARRVPALAIAGPEPHVQVVLVRRLVLRETDVAVDAHDRSVHARLDLDLRLDRAQPRRQRLRERHRRGQEGLLVVVAVSLEPRPVVVLADARQEPHRLLREAVEAHRARAPFFLALPLAPRSCERQAHQARTTRSMSARAALASARLPIFSTRLVSPVPSRRGWRPGMRAPMWNIRLACCLLFGKKLARFPSN